MWVILEIGAFLFLDLSFLSKSFVGIDTVKLVLQPLLVWIIAKMLGLGTLETNAVVLMASLPVAINIYLMAQDFKAEEGAASNSIFVSTFLSALTVPLTLTLLGAAPQF